MDTKEAFEVWLETRQEVRSRDDLETAFIAGWSFAQGKNIKEIIEAE